MVNIVGDHAVAHLQLDAPLTSDIHGVAAPMSHWVRTSAGVADLAADGAEAVRQANARPGRIATLVLPANVAWSEVPAEAAPAAAVAPGPAPQAVRDFNRIVQALRDQPESTLLLLGDRALRAFCTEIAGRIAAATGCALRAEFYTARLERGAGRGARGRAAPAVCGGARTGGARGVQAHHPGRRQGARGVLCLPGPAGTAVGAGL